MRVVLVGLPGFEFCLQNRADTTAQTIRRAINKNIIGSTKHNKKQGDQN